MSSQPTEDSPPTLHLRVSFRGRTQTCALPTSGSLTLGRADDCDIQIADSAVSRYHVRIHVGREITVEDLGSQNGTTLLARGTCPNAETASRGLRLEAGLQRSLHIDSLLQFGGAVVEIEQHLGTVARGDGVGVLRDEEMRRLYAVADRIGESSISVILEGESGVGKDVLAQHVHRSSARRDGPFLSLNCGAVPESLLESELFGHEQGAFTGAQRSKPGLFETANGGTVFLDEIGEIPASMQVKLLRFLETQEFTRLGSTVRRKVDVRFVAATNKRLEREVAEGRFRGDLFYRLNGITLKIPPLRARPDDVLPLAEHLLHKLAGDSAPTLSAAAELKLRSFAWPGNVRQLRNVLERALVLGRSAAVLEPEHIDLPSGAPESYASGPSLATGTSPQYLREQATSLERERIVEALKACDGNQTRAAGVLGLTRRALIGRLDKYEIPRPRKNRSASRH